MKNLPHSCTQMRRKLVKHQNLNLATSKTEDAGQEWVNEPCSTPLFSDEERQRGTCRSCAAGWTHEHNFPIETTEAANAA